MYTEVKIPFAHLRKDQNCQVVFFENNFLGEENKPIASWDDIHGNYPRWSMATHTIEEAEKRVREMVEEEDWELYETSEDALKDLLCFV